MPGNNEREEIQSGISVLLADKRDESINDVIKWANNRKRLYLDDESYYNGIEVFQKDFHESLTSDILRMHNMMQNWGNRLKNTLTDLNSISIQLSSSLDKLTTPGINSSLESVNYPNLKIIIPNEEKPEYQDKGNEITLLKEREKQFIEIIKSSQGFVQKMKYELEVINDERNKLLNQYESLNSSLRSSEKLIGSLSNRIEEFEHKESLRMEKIRSFSICDSMSRDFNGCFDYSYFDSPILEILPSYKIIHPNSSIHHNIFSISPLKIIRHLKVEQHNCFAIDGIIAKPDKEIPKEPIRINQTIIVEEKKPLFVSTNLQYIDIAQIQRVFKINNLVENHIMPETVKIIKNISLKAPISLSKSIAYNVNLIPKKKLDYSAIFDYSYETKFIESTQSSQFIPFVPLSPHTKPNPSPPISPKAASPRAHFSSKISHNSFKIENNDRIEVENNQKTTIIKTKTDIPEKQKKHTILFTPKSEILDPYEEDTIQHIIKHKPSLNQILSKASTLTSPESEIIQKRIPQHNRTQSPLTRTRNTNQFRMYSLLKSYHNQNIRGYNRANDRITFFKALSSRRDIKQLQLTVTPLKK